jgi:hypothetical protein
MITILMFSLSTSRMRRLYSIVVRAAYMLACGTFPIWDVYLRNTFYALNLAFAFGKCRPSAVYGPAWHFLDAFV